MKSGFDKIQELTRETKNKIRTIERKITKKIERTKFRVLIGQVLFVVVKVCRTTQGKKNVPKTELN